jgi:hypothetical protein
MDTNEFCWEMLHQSETIQAGVVIVCVDIHCVDLHLQDINPWSICFLGRACISVIYVGLSTSGPRAISILQGP